LPFKRRGIAPVLAALSWSGLIGNISPALPVISVGVIASLSKSNHTAHQILPACPSRTITSTSLGQQGRPTQRTRLPSVSSSNRGQPAHHRVANLQQVSVLRATMDILQIRLVAVNPASRPQVIPINALPDSDFVLGRASFSDGEDTIISRRHARFTINPVPGGQAEQLYVSNLSNVNGLLVNFEPLLPFDATLLCDRDEIVPSSMSLVTPRGSLSRM